MRVVVSLAWARLRHRPARWLLVALGVAAATVLPVVTQGIAASVAAEALRYGVESLSPGDRSLAAIRSSVAMAPQEVAALDATARDALAPLTGGPVWAQMLTRTISDGVGGTYYFGAADGLSSLIRITDGRAPTSCTPTRCEVVAVGPGTPAPPAESGLVVVGRAVRSEPLLLAGSFDPGDGAPILLADGVAAAAQLTYLEQFQRAYAWVGPVDLQRVNALGVDGYLAASAQASIVLNRSRLSLTSPDQQLRAEADRADLSSRRFALLGGAATALLLGFGVIGAIGLRRDHVATAALLRRRGARTRHVVVLAGVAATVPALAGAVLGAALGALGVAALAKGEGLPAWATALAALRTATPAVTLGAVAAAVVVAITLLSGASAKAAWRGVDIVVVAGAVAAALALARGAVTATSLQQGFDPLLVALPVLAAVCGGLLVGRAWPPLTTAAARLVPRRLLAPRLALVGAVRNPLRPVATAAFLAAAVGIVTFAGAYQATLRQGAADQAAFAVPLDANARVGPSLRQPLEVATVEQYRAAGLQPYGVVRSVSTVRINSAQAVTPDLIGVDPAVLPLLHGWQDVVGASDPATVAGSMTATGTSAGMTVPAGATSVSFPAQGNVSDLDIAVWLRLPDGRDTPVELTDTGAGSVSGRLAAPAPAGARLFALTLIESEIGNTRRQHHEGEGGTALPALTGTVSLGAPSYDVAATAPDDWSGWGSGEATVTGDSQLRIGYSLTGAEVVARAGFATEPALPVLVDPDTAALAVNGVLDVNVGARVPIVATVVGVLPRFPDAGPRFVLADARALADRLDARDPGTGSVSEVWLAAAPGVDAGAALARAPFDLLRVDLRQDRESRLAGDPVAVGAAGLLAGSALLAFVVALLALVLLVVAERRDESAQLYAWESDGVSPGTLRRSLFLRAVAVVAIGVPGGVVIGLLLSRITTALVRVTAVGGIPVPPLTTAVTPLWTVIALSVGVLTGVVACAVLTAAALRERLPRRPEEGLT